MLPPVNGQLNGDACSGAAAAGAGQKLKAEEVE